MQSIKKYWVEINKLEIRIIINLLGGKQNDLAMIGLLAKKFSSGACFAQALSMGEESPEKCLEMVQITVRSLQ